MIKSAYLGTTVFTVVRHKDGENRTFDAQCKIDMAVYIGASDIDAAVDMGIARGSASMSANLYRILSGYADSLKKPKNYRHPLSST